MTNGIHHLNRIENSVKKGTCFDMGEQQVQLRAYIPLSENGTSSRFQVRYIAVNKQGL